MGMFNIHNIIILNMFSMYNGIDSIPNCKPTDRVDILSELLLMQIS